MHWCFPRSELSGFALFGCPTPGALVSQFDLPDLCFPLRNKHASNHGYDKRLFHECSAPAIPAGLSKFAPRHPSCLSPPPPDFPLWGGAARVHVEDSAVPSFLASAGTVDFPEGRLPVITNWLNGQVPMASRRRSRRPFSVAMRTAGFGPTPSFSVKKVQVVGPDPGDSYR